MYVTNTINFIKHINLLCSCWKELEKGQGNWAQPENKPPFSAWYGNWAIQKCTQHCLSCCFWLWASPDNAHTHGNDARYATLESEWRGTESWQFTHFCPQLLPWENAAWECPWLCCPRHEQLWKWADAYLHCKHLPWWWTGDRERGGEATATETRCGMCYNIISLHAAFLYKMVH